MHVCLGGGFHIKGMALFINLFICNKVENCQTLSYFLSLSLCLFLSFSPLSPSISPHSQESFTRIPRESICITSTRNDPALGAATLEVGLNNPILEAGFEIICSPTSSPGTLDAVRKTLQVCQVELHPFFVYGYDGKGPMNQQVRERT